MAYSKCSNCGSSSFEIVQNSPSKSNYKLTFVQCSSCGAVVGVMDYYNIGSRISDLEKKVDSLSSLHSELSVINQNIANLFQLIRQKK